MKSEDVGSICSAIVISAMILSGGFMLAVWGGAVHMKRMTIEVNVTIEETPP